MKILICPDKFKGSLTAEEVCQALSRGLRRRYPGAGITQCPLADGGDGSLAVLARYFDGETVPLEVQDPLGRPIGASYLRDGDTAYVEMASASGLALLAPGERNVLAASSFGTGQLIAHALLGGCREVYLFIGGSATNDGGMGIAEALGYRFFDASGQRLAPSGENLMHLHRIDNNELIFDPENLTVNVVCDVDNPLFGPTGAAYTYAPQKGADPGQVALLDDGLRNLSERLFAQGYPDISDLPGAGAAGGIGGGAVAFLNGQLRSGTDTFLEISRLEEHIQKADLVITGEGHLDAQTVQGKLLSGVCRLARQHGKPVVGVCGAARPGIAERLGMERVITVLERSSSLEEAMAHAAEKLVEIGEEL